MCLGDFLDIMTLVGGVKFDASDIDALDQHVRTCESPACLDWMHTVLLDDEMIDTFAARHPDAVERFTCWHQYVVPSTYNSTLCVCVCVCVFI